MKEYQNNNASREQSIQPEELLKDSVWKPLSVSMGLMFFQQFTGINAMVFYTVDIFESSGSTLDGKYATIIIGVVQFICTAVSGFSVAKLFACIKFKNIEWRWNSWKRFHDAGGSLRTTHSTSLFGQRCISVFSVYGHFLLSAASMGRSWDHFHQLDPSAVIDIIFYGILRRLCQRSLYHHGRTVSVSLSSSIRAHGVIFQSLVCFHCGADFPRYADYNGETRCLLVLHEQHAREHLLRLFLPARNQRTHARGNWEAILSQDRCHPPC